MIFQTFFGNIYEPSMEVWSKILNKLLNNLIKIENKGELIKNQRDQVN